MRTISIVLVLLTAFPVAAQESAGFNLSEHTVNAGGHPSDGVVLASTSYRITLDAVGDPVAGRDLASATYRMDGSFTACYPPPGEVRDLNFSGPATLLWDHEKSEGRYNLYRDLLSDLSGLAYGTCEQSDIPSNFATDTDEPPSGVGYFYLATAENRLSEEGTKGSNSGGAEREGNVCP